MPNRVVLNSSGLKISQPGFNVLTANNAQLQFSSDWSAMGVVQSGTYDLTSWSVSTSTALHSGTIPLVKTFSTPPFCVFYLLQGGYEAPLFYGHGGAVMVDRGDNSNPSRSALVIQVGTTSISVRGMYYKASSGVATPFYNMRFFVFDNNL